MRNVWKMLRRLYGEYSIRTISIGLQTQNPATELATWFLILLWKTGNYAVVYNAKCM